MKKILVCTFLTMAFVGTSYAVPMRTAMKGLEGRETSASRQGDCHLLYYNICSTWVYYWSGWCFCMWDPNDPEAPTANQPEWGVVFDLVGCPGSCRHLTDVWMGCFTFTPHATSDVEIYCADSYGCSVGPPLGGIYNFFHSTVTRWQHFVFGTPGVDGLELCPCDECAGLFLVKVRNLCAPANVCYAPFSDHCAGNVEEACGDWRCDPGHSYVYVSCVDYCAVYGMPSPLWIDYPDPAPCTPCPTGPPPGCFSYYGTGFYSEWLIDCYITCLGPTAVEESSWTGIKAQYR